MGINSVDMNRALTSESYAAQLVRSKNITPSERGQIIAQWGAEKVNKWELVDSTEYQIDDSDYNNSRAQGKKNTAESVGYDGHKSYRAVVDGVVDTAANVAGQTVLKKAVISAATKAAKEATKKVVQKAAEKAAAQGAEAAAKNLAKTATEESVKKAAEATAKKAAEEAAKKTAEEASAKAAEEAAKKKAASAGEKASFIIGCTLGLAEGIKYKKTKPNKDQVDAARKLQETELPEGEGRLYEAQDMMASATEEVTQLTEEAATVNDEANDKIEDNKTIIDFYKKQYDTLKAKADAAKNGGEPLTPEEKAVLAKITPLIGELGEEITTTNEETSGAVEDLYGDIEGYQDQYDAGAETIAEVEGVTDYAEGFDSNTEVMCYVEGAVQSINVGMSTAASVKAAKYALSGSAFFGATTWAWAFAAMGATGAYFSGKGALEQFGWASEVHNEINSREAVQEVEEASHEVYDEELDNFAGSLEIVEDLEIELPDEIPTVDENQLGTSPLNQSLMFVAENNNDNDNDNTLPTDEKDNKDDKEII